MYFNVAKMQGTEQICLLVTYINYWFVVHAVNFLQHNKQGKDK